MRIFLRFGSCFVIVLFLLIDTTRAADLVLGDLDELSPSGQYEVTARLAPVARSGKKGKQPATQGQFTYICKDTRTKKVLWTLPQPKGGADKATMPPPVRLAVSDDGWTVVFTDAADFIPVDLQGNPHGRAHLSDAINSEEINSHLYQTNVGPTWTSRSLWYFLNVEGTCYLVVRPWWGHRVAVDLKAGKVVEPIPPAVQDAAVADERRQVMRDLQVGADTFKTWEAKCCPKVAQNTNTAAYLAGALHLTEAIPLLRRLEPTIYNGESSLAFIDESERKQHGGEVSPFTHREYDLRRMVQLSLRRLGEKPEPLPCTVLERTGKGYSDRIVYEPPPLAGPRADNADKVKVGMKTEEVCQLLGVPDYILGTRWEYDLDSQPPRTLVIEWKKWQAAEVTPVEPARWQEGSQAEDREF